MIQFVPASGNADLQQIISLQQQNLPAGLSAEEMAAEGFVTVVHSLPVLEKMNNIEQHMLAKDDDKVIGYLLAMTPASRADIPVLVPMFDVLDQVDYNGKKIGLQKYILVGQVCVAKQYRGKGILDDCYAAYKKHFSARYDFAITEIATANQRSINAHKRIGFSEIHRYTDPAGTEWSIVVWDWKR